MRKVLLFMLIFFVTSFSFAQEDNYEKAKRCYKEAEHSALRSDYEEALKTAQDALEHFLRSGDTDKAEEMKNIINKSSAAMSRIDERIKKAIKNRHIVIGMSKEDVIESWGQPRDINRTVTSSCVYEEWCYGDFLKGPGRYVYFKKRIERYVYFENGIVTSWQD